MDIGVVERWNYGMLNFIVKLQFLTPKGLIDQMKLNISKYIRYVEVINLSNHELVDRSLPLTPYNKEKYNGLD